MMRIPGHRWSTSYRAQLTVGYVLIVALFAGAWGWSLFGPLTDRIIVQQRENLEAVARAGALVLALPDSSADSVSEQLVAGTGLRMTLVASDGTVLADSEEDATAMQNHGDRPEIVAALAGDVGYDRRVSSTQDTERIYVAVPAEHQGSAVAFRVSESLDEVGAVALSARRFGLGLLLVALVVAGFIVARLTAAATEPVARLSAAARAMAGGDLSARVPMLTGDLAVLSTALADLREQMRRRLDELTADERNLRAVLDGLTDSVFLLHDGRVRFANSAASTTFRAPATGWRDKRIEETGLPASITSALQTFSDEPQVIECGPDPGGRYLKATVLPLNPVETAARTLLVISDITERILLDQVRRDFVANASHELKTPAASIMLLAESVEDAAADGDTEQALAFAMQIGPEAARLGDLVSDLLDLSRLESTPAPNTVTDMRQATGNALVGHRTAAAHRGLELRFDDTRVAGQDLYAGADPTDVAVALDNLLDNAIKYTDRGSVTVALAADAESVHVSITDTGPGIPAEDLPRVFERFYRIDRARSRERGGTGLGLALVRHVVERADGSVEVTSEPGAGSSFTISLPRR